MKHEREGSSNNFSPKALAKRIGEIEFEIKASTIRRVSNISLYTITGITQVFLWGGLAVTIAGDCNNPKQEAGYDFKPDKNNLDIPTPKPLPNAPTLTLIPGHESPLFPRGK